MRLAFFDALSSSNLLKCDNQYRNQVEEELRACGENEEGWNDLKINRTTAEAKPGDGAPRLFGAYKLVRTEARLATGKRLKLFWLYVVSRPRQVSEIVKHNKQPIKRFTGAQAWPFSFHVAHSG
eukprot:4364756-Pleurochrysis_carterae.AAC.1